jgi:predicted phage terminase large subunit-like protein
MPTPQGGVFVKAIWFQNYAPNERPEKIDRIVQSWDTSNKASELSDFSVCTSWRIKGKDLYPLRVLRRRMEYRELKRAVREQREPFEANVVLIEDKASGTQLIQELMREGLYAVTRYQPQSDKIMRMHAQTAMIENGFAHLPKEAAWLAEYLRELTAFPEAQQAAAPQTPRLPPLSTLFPLSVGGGHGVRDPNYHSPSPINRLAKNSSALRTP